MQLDFGDLGIGVVVVGVVGVVPKPLDGDADGVVGDLVAVNGDIIDAAGELVALNHIVAENVDFDVVASQILEFGEFHCSGDQH